MRNYSSPATPAQRAFVLGLLEERIVGDSLLGEVESLVDGLTDGDCREYIPRLQACPKRAVSRSSRQMQYDDHDMADWEDWRDHPDAIAGHPMEHGSH